MRTKSPLKKTHFSNQSAALLTLIYIFQCLNEQQVNPYFGVDTWFYT